MSNRRRANSINSRRKLYRNAHSSSSEIKFGSPIRLQNSGELISVSQSSGGAGKLEEPLELLRFLRQKRRTGPFIQPNRWIPLVTWPMGTCSAVLSGNRECHICRLTRPCNSLTPLAARDNFKASTVIQKGSLSLRGLTRPNLIISGNGTDSWPRK